jgi:DNA-directed RNA polymerase subunit RPC12/RpoP
MAFVEGGAFRCDAEDFQTESVKEWNEHCRNNPDHTESGATPCITCGQQITFEGLPYHPINEITGSKNISLRCDECNGKFVESLKVKKALDKEVKLAD